MLIDYYLENYYTPIFLHYVYQSCLLEDSTCNMLLLSNLLVIMILLNSVIYAIQSLWYELSYKHIILWKFFNLHCRPAPRQKLSYKFIWKFWDTTRWFCHTSTSKVCCLLLLYLLSWMIPQLLTSVGLAQASPNDEITLWYDTIYYDVSYHDVMHYDLICYGIDYHDIICYGAIVQEDLHGFHLHSSFSWCCSSQSSIGTPTKGWSLLQ